MTALFLFGTLRHLPLLEAVLGHSAYSAEPAVAPGYQARRVRDAIYPALETVSGQRAEGILLTGLSEVDLERLDFYENAPGYHYLREDIDVETAGKTVRASYYRPETSAQTDGAWLLDEWVARYGDVVTAASDEFMAWFGQGGPYPDFDQMMVRWASRERAGQMPTPTALRSSQHRDTIRVEATRRPYTFFFAVAEQDLHFPRFDGGTSAKVTRAALMGGDAVTVLPYDPVRDRVLMVEQFRFGAHMRGDCHPFVLEPPAGRIDAGETPQDAAHRELAEESGVTARELIQFSSYYPTPGVSTEYIYSFVALCDLPDDAASLGGLDAEDEDIRNHILSFEDAFALIETGEADAAPLVLTLLWLAGARDRLRRPITA